MVLNQLVYKYFKQLFDQYIIIHIRIIELIELEIYIEELKTIDICTSYFMGRKENINHVSF